MLLFQDLLVMMTSYPSMISLRILIKTHARHSSVLRIKESIKYDRHFSFSYVNIENVCTKLSDLNIHKPRGYDAIPYFVITSRG